MSDVKPVGFVQKAKLERLVSGYSVVAALYKDQFADEVPIYSQKTITALQAEIEALRKDGERHVGLIQLIATGYMLVCGCNDPSGGPCDWIVLRADGTPVTDYYDESADAIDAAIAKEKQT